MDLPYAEPYKIKMVEPIRITTRQEREGWIKEAKYNLFRLRADQVFIDVLTDSGTGAMSDRQWSAMMLGDESYAGASAFFNMKNAVKDITGFDYCLPTHQGRAAENVLFSALVREGDYIPGNSHFDTTKGHIEYRKAHAIDCTIDEAMDTQLELPFKGNVCPVKLEQALANHHERTPLIIVTITNNTAGGQPVSMANIREVRNIADKYGKPVLIDAARFAENAYFIKMREKGYSDKTIKEIVKEIFSYADGMTMSAKKDANVNMGGFIATRREDWYEQSCTYIIMFEGYITYGGLSGRDMNAVAVGLDENTEFDVLHARMSQVAYLAHMLDEYGVPYQRPVGGHAIFVDARKVLPDIPKEEFAAQTLAIELYLEGGVRGCEIGFILADRDLVTRENRTDGLDLLRLAIPRRTYTNNHMNVIAAALKNVYDRRHKITSGVRIVKEAAIMRHFTVELEALPKRNTNPVTGRSTKTGPDSDLGQEPACIVSKDVSENLWQLPEAVPSFDATDVMGAHLMQARKLHAKSNAERSGKQAIFANTEFNAIESSVSSFLTEEDSLTSSAVFSSPKCKLTSTCLLKKLFIYPGL